MMDVEAVFCQGKQYTRITDVTNPDTFLTILHAGRKLFILIPLSWRLVEVEQIKVTETGRIFVTVEDTSRFSVSLDDFFCEVGV